MQLKNKRFKKTVISLGLATAMAVTPTIGNLNGVGASIIAEAAATNEISTYDQLKAACKNGGKYTLVSNISVKEPVQVTAEVILKSKDDAEYIIAANTAMSSVFEVKKGGKLTLGETTSDLKRVAVRGGTPESKGSIGTTDNAVIAAYDGGIVYLKRAHLYRSAGVGLKLVDHSEGYLYGYKGNNKDAVENSINGISPNTAKGGVVCVFASSRFEMSGGIIGSSSNQCSLGGVTVRPSCSFKMTGGTITSCVRGAGDIDIKNWGTDTIKNGYGGGVFNQGTFTMTGGTISSNSSKCGGGVYNSGTMSMTGGKITNNSITGTSESKKGSAIYNTNKLELGDEALITSEQNNINVVTLSDTGKLNVISKLKKEPAVMVELEKKEPGTTVADCTGGMDASNIVKNIDVKDKGDLILRGVGTKLTLSKKCKITFDLNGDSQIEDAETKEIYFNEGFKLPSKEEIMSKYSKKGHVLADALKGPNGDLQYDITCNATDDMLIQAIWNPKKYTVSYDLNGGTGTQPAPVSSDFINGITITDVIPERTGFDFGGWSVTQNPSVTSGAGIYQPNAKVNYEIEDDTKLYAIWNPKVITITYNTDGGTSIPATIGDYINRPKVTDTIPVRPGFKFIGWVNEANNNAETVNNTVGENTVLRAKWEEIKYTIKYDTSGGSKIEDTVGTYTTKPVVTSTIPTKDGYNFICWKDEAGNIILPGSIIDKDLKLTAEWKATPVTITYDTAGGAPMEPTVGDKNSNPTVKAPAQREGYTFEGWKDPNVENIVTPGTAYNHDVTLKAIWVKTDNIEWKMNVTNKSHSIKIYDNETAAISYSKNKFKKALSLTIKATRTTLKEGTNEKETANANVDYQIVKKGKQYVSSQNAWKSAKNGKITVSNAMNSSIYIRLTAGGKAKIYKTDGFSVDTISPTITGVKNKKFYKKTVTIKVKDTGSGIKYVTLNGKKVKSTFKVSKQGSYKVVAVDKFNNKKTVLFSIHK